MTHWHALARIGRFVDTVDGRRAVLVTSNDPGSAAA